MLAALAAAALFQTGEIAPGNLTYSEVYACSTLARAGWESMYEGGTSPVTTGERPLRPRSGDLKNSPKPRRSRPGFATAWKAPRSRGPRRPHVTSSPRSGLTSVAMPANSARRSSASPSVEPDGGG